MVDFDACLGSPNSDDVMTFPRGLMYDHVRVKIILTLKGMQCFQSIRAR